MTLKKEISLRQKHKDKKRSWLYFRQLDKKKKMNLTFQDESMADLLTGC